MFTLEQNFYSIQFFFYSPFSFCTFIQCKISSKLTSVCCCTVLVRVEALWAFWSILDIWRFQMENEAAPFDLKPFSFLIQSWEMK